MPEYSAADLQEGAKQICRALWGKYTDINGREQSVLGDMTKVRYVKGLSTAAQRLLTNLEHTSRRLPGTQETRRLMRFDIHALRVRYGVPIFVTFSPDESHNLLMVRLSRTRREDPILTTGCDKLGKDFCDRDRPPVGRDLSAEQDVVLGVPVSDLLPYIPSYDQRKQVLARDALASVDAFWIIVLAAYEHLFGLRVCPDCPNCNHGEHTVPCQDLLGSNATSAGGIFGRLDAAYAAVEAQKSTGSLHAHLQPFFAVLAPAHATGRDHGAAAHTKFRRDISIAKLQCTRIANCLRRTV